MTTLAVPAGTRQAGRANPAVVTGLFVAGVAGCAMQLSLPYVTWLDQPVDFGSLVLDTVSNATFAFLGLYAFVKRPDNRVGPLMMAVAFAGWLMLIGWVATDVTYTFGTWVFKDLWLVVLGHLFLAFPTGRLEIAVDRMFVTAIYAWWLVGNIAHLLFLDFRANGWAFDNVLLAHSDNDLAGTIGRTNSLITAAIALVFLVLMAGHWRRATPAGRRVLAPVLWACLPTAAWVVSRVAGETLRVAPVSDVAEGPLGTLAIMALPVGFTIGLLRTRLGRSRVGDLVVELGSSQSPGRVRDTLARVLHDPDLEIAYRLPGENTYVNEDGRPVRPASDSARVVTPIEREGETLAILVHDPGLMHDPGLLQSAVAATRLAVENERLQAAIRAQLEQVRESRARIVEAGDAERRRVERNLHDGAQQRLITASMALRRVRERVPAGESELASAVDDVTDELRSAIVELRELARGIHPSILTDEGLGAAIRSLADRSALSVTVAGVPDGRLPDPVEASAYFVVAESLANVAKYASATRTVVRAGVEDSWLEVEVRDDGVGGADVSKGTGLLGLQDRVAALGGRLEVESGSGGTAVRAMIPVDEW